MKSELKLAFKVLARRKVFTAISLFGITMTLLVLLVATAVLDNVFAPREPEQNFDRVLMVATVGRYGPESSSTTSLGYQFIDRYVRPIQGAERTAIYSSIQSTSLYRGDSRIETMIKHTDGAYWKVLGFHFVEGRPFTEQEDRDGARVAVISEKLRDKFFGDVKAEGRTLDIDGQSFRVIGVVPAVPFTRIAAYSEIWVPVGSYPSSEYRHEFIGDFTALVMAKSRADFPRLKREFRNTVAAIHPEDTSFTTVVAGLDTPFEAAARMLVGNRNERAPLILRAVFVTLALLFMALPALNLITLNLSRILERAGEIGVRKAFGAPRRTLVRQFVTENVVLTLIGGVVAFVLAAILVPLLNDTGVIPDARFELNIRIFVYGMLLAAFFGILSGVYPAWRMSRLHPVEAIRGGAA